MHHAYARRDCRLAVRNLGRLTVDSNLSGVGAIETVKDRHQRRFAGSVFPHNSVNGSAPDRQTDIAVCLNRSERFRDAEEFDCGRGGIMPRPFTIYCHEG